MTEFNETLEALKPMLDQLRKLPSPQTTPEWPDYSGIDGSEKTLSDLTTLVRLDSERKIDGEGNFWLPVHAWRILSQRRAAQALPHLIETLISAHEEDDWTRDELPRAIAKYGADGIPQLKSALFENIIFREDVWNYVGIVATLEEIGKNFPEERTAICRILRDRLKDSELNSPTLNAFLVSSLVDLKDVESVPEIEAAYSKDMVDEEIHDWAYVREKLGPLVPLPESVSKREYSPTDFSYSSDERFQKCLKSVGSAFNTDELRCFLLGSVLAIDLVPPSQLISEVLIDFDGDEIEFETQGQATYFTRELLGLWNEISKYQDKLYKLPSLECDHIHHGSECDEKAEWSVYSFRQRMHLEHFLGGLETGATKAESFEDQNAAKFITFLKTKLEALDALEKKRDEDRTAPTKSLIAEIRDYWDSNYLTFAEACKKERLRVMEKREFVKAHRNIGRNDPCPCGSGTKFKKCCLLKYN